MSLSRYPSLCLNLPLSLHEMFDRFSRLSVDGLCLAEFSPKSTILTLGGKNFPNCVRLLELTAAAELEVQLRPANRTPLFFLFPPSFTNALHEIRHQEIPPSRRFPADPLLTRI